MQHTQQSPPFTSGEALGAEDLRPFLEGQVRGQHEAVVLIDPAGMLFFP